MKGEWSGLRSERSVGEQMKRILRVLECLQEFDIFKVVCEAISEY